MIDNYLNMKEMLKLLIFNHIISDYLWSYGESFNINIYVFINLFIYLTHNITSVQFLCVQ